MDNKKQRIFSELNNGKFPFTGNLYKKNQRRISFSKLFKWAFVSVFFISIVFAVIYGVFLNNKTSAESINQNTILNQLAKNLILPEDEIINIMRVSNAKDLEKQDIFYKNVKNGDYVIIYKSMIILFNFDKSLIKGIKTLQN